MAPADHLEVLSIASDLPALLYQALCLLEFAQAGQDQPLHPHAPRERTTDGYSGTQVGVAGRELERTIEYRHTLAVPTNVPEGVGEAQDGHDEGRIAGLLGQRGRLACQLCELAHVTVVDAPDDAVEVQQHRL